MIYFETPEYCVALNAKTGSSTIARMIIKQFYGKSDWIVSTVKHPEGIKAENRQWHHLVPTTRIPDKPVVLMVRDPLERFISALQQINLGDESVDSALDSLVNDSPMNKLVNHIPRKNQMKSHMSFKPQEKEKRPNHLRDNIHFWNQYEYIIEEAYCFKFPVQIKDFSCFVGITMDPPVVNKAKKEKSKLTEEQKNKALSYYSIDKNLFDSIKEPGQIIRRKECR